MKAKKLLTLLPVLALAACGGAKPLTQEQAVERANQILAAQESITEVPSTFKVVEHFDQVNVDGETTETTDITNTIVVANQFVSFSQHAQIVGEQSVAQDLTVWAYVKDNAVTLAVSQDGVGRYMSQEIPAGVEIGTAELDSSVASLLGEESLLADYDLDYFKTPDLLAGVANLWLTEEEIAATGFQTYEVHASSKGEGHIALAREGGVSMTEEGITMAIEVTEEYVFNNNLLTSYVSYLSESMSMEGYVSSSVTNETVTIAYSAKAAYPNLSTFTPVGA